MNFLNMPELTIGDTTASVPIIQGGMGVGISLSGLASAVANEGGIGVIAANAIGMIEPDYYSNGKEANLRALRNEIRRARSLSKGAIGVNLMVAVNDFNELLQVVIEERADFVFLGAGLPIKGIPVKELRAAGVKVVPIVSSARAARLIFKSWEKNYADYPDAVVVEGPKAGGHLGFKQEQIDDPAFSLENIIPEVVSVMKEYEVSAGKHLPVIAAGGIFSGQDIYNFIKLGAKGVQMATRFVATHECDADIRFKEAYVNSKEEEIVIIKSPVGMPGRAIKNQFLDDVETGKSPKIRCPWRCLESCEALKAKYCISEALNNARKGELSGGFAFSGINAWRVKSITSVKELMAGLKAEFEAATIKGFLAYMEEQFNFKEKFAGFKEEQSAIIGARLAQWKTEYELAMDRVALQKKEYEKTFDLKMSEFKSRYDQKCAELKESYDRNMITLREEYEKALHNAAGMKEELADKLAEMQSPTFNTSK